jgi:hypothetical protein
MDCKMGQRRGRKRRSNEGGMGRGRECRYCTTLSTMGHLKVKK